MSLSQKAKKISQHSSKILGTKITQSQALELLAYAEGFNNSNTAIALEKSLLNQVNKIEEFMANVSSEEKLSIRRSILELELEELILFMQKNKCKWKITQRGFHYEIVLTTSAFDIYLEEFFKIGEIKLDLKTQVAFLLNPVQHKVFQNQDFSEAEELLSSKKIAFNKIQIEQEADSSDVGKKGKPLFLHVIKELKKQDFQFATDAILHQVGFSESDQKEFWSHVQKYHNDKFYTMGDCPCCGGACGEFAGKRETASCDEGLGDFTKDDLLNPYPYYPF